MSLQSWLDKRAVRRAWRESGLRMLAGNWVFRTCDCSETPYHGCLFIDVGTARPEPGKDMPPDSVKYTFGYWPDGTRIKRIARQACDCTRKATFLR